MFVVNSISGSQYSKRRPSSQSAKFKNLLDESEDRDTQNEDFSDSPHQVDDVLNEYIAVLRLKLNRLGYNQKIPQKASLYSSSMQALMAVPENKYLKKVCHQCQLTYQQNSMRGEPPTTYFVEDDKVNISI